MGSGLFALAAFFLGWIGGATAAPMMATAAAPSLILHREVETVRWRHRYRNYGWRERGAGTRDGASELGNAAADETSPVLPKRPVRTLAAGPIATALGGATRLATSSAASRSI